MSATSPPPVLPAEGHRPGGDYPLFPTPGPPLRIARQGLRLQVLLYVLTAITTFAAGVVGWEPMILGVDADVAAGLEEHGRRGLAYMLAVLAVLSAHEAGHFIAAAIHGIPATLPFFLPVPVLLTGTLGAVIGMDGGRAGRRQLFDIALAGPVAGLVVALPCLAVGMMQAVPAEQSLFALPLAGKWMLAALRPDIPVGGAIEPTALFMAGWVGLLVTGLNMMPISQLDGGHIIYALFGDRSVWLARGVLLAAMTLIIVLGRTNWVLMVVLVTLLGVDHPPSYDEGPPPGPWRTTLGLMSLLIPLLLFMPEPLLLD
ncbi:MAG: site-2 protease family protein [Planctomycetota bacterium]|nr:MAG: site-2 protease family protein [Planctomycetota bacterium]